MRVSVISDLHLEFGELTLPGGDVLILSGDVLEAKRLKLQNYTPEQISINQQTGIKDQRYYNFFHEECAKYKDVIYVLGNHEHYGFKYHKTQAHLQANLPGNVHILEREHVELNGVLFLGATLWTDMNNFDPLTLMHMKRMMNDYRQITMFNEAKSLYHKLTPEYTAAEHVKTKEYFKHMLSENRQGKNLPVVVCTHHAPSKLSIHPHYARDYIMNGAYSSDLSEFILDNPEIKFWTHGHTHDPFDYTIGDTRVICNPRGYYGHETRAFDFDPTIGFDI
jgi:predicted phosphodiesterase